MVPVFPQQRVVQAGYHFEFAASFQAMRVGRVWPRSCPPVPRAIRRTSERGDKSAPLIPIRFVATNTVHKHDKLALASDALVLSKMLGRDLRIGNIVHGNELRHTQSQQRMDTLSACEPLLVL